MLKPTLDALAYLHSKGFVHGRIKPANIMAIDDQLKLSSDGVCRMGESSGGRGTPGVYDSPEAASGRISPAGDVWSLGMTLVEALTQRLPVWERTEGGEPLMPQTLPPPFFDIASHCLRRDPQRRWTVAEVVAWLRLTSPAPPFPTPRQKTSAKPQKAFSNWWYILPPVAFGLTLAALLAGPRLLNRHPETQPAHSVVSEEPGVQPKPERKPVMREAEPSKQKTGEEERSSSRTAPLPSSLRSSGAGAKTSTRRLVQSEVLQEVLPDVPQKARDTIRGTVRVSVRVAVDPSGSVVGATLDSPGPSKYFANLALQAARRWEFRPLEADGRYVSSEWILRFEFKRTATKAFQVLAAP
jgi:TonB family protein